MQKLFDALINSAGLTEEHCRHFTGQLQSLSLKKNEYLIQAGSVCNVIGFVESGVLRSYIIKNGDEFNIDFYLPNSFVSSYTSFLTRQKTNGFIQALADTVVHIISYEKWSELLTGSNDWYRLGKYISDNLFIRKCRRETSLLMDSAEERYQLLLNTYESIEQMVPQYHIAAYLGIRPESLSRLKNLTYINAKEK